LSENDKMKKVKYFTTSRIHEITISPKKDNVKRSFN